MEKKPIDSQKIFSQFEQTLNQIKDISEATSRATADQSIYEPRQLSYPLPHHYPTE